MNKLDLNKSSIFKYTTSRPVTIAMLTAAVLLFGMMSYTQLTLDLMPDITYPSLTVRTEYPGSAPEEVETAISRPVEEVLGVVTNLVSISSISKAGQSDVILEFNWDTDMNKAITEVREKLDQVFLPDDATKPLILKYDPSLDPIVRFGFYGTGDLYYDRYIVEEQIKRILEGMEGVASAKVKGGYEEEIRVDLDEQKITLMGMDIQQVRQRLSQENVNLAGGELKEGQTEYIVRTLNEFRTVQEIGEITIGTASLRPVRLKDIGEVYKSHKERQIITRLNGRESVELEIYKEADANIVEVANLVRNKMLGSPEQKAYVENMRRQEAEADSIRKHAEANPDTTTVADSTDAQMAAQSEGENKGGPGGDHMNQFAAEMLRKAMTDYVAYNLPQGMKVELLTDQSIFIQNSIDEVSNTAIIGGILAVIVLFLFLSDLSTTVIVGLAIPISILATFLPMKLFDVSLNIMSLGGLALGIGMLVDNSIVVTESIFRCREEGDGFIDSVVRGTREVGGAVTASTLTTIAVFFPMVFVEGIAGQIFGDLSLTVVFSLIASLGVALFFIPMLASRKIEAKAFGEKLLLASKFFRDPVTQKLTDPIGKKVSGFFSKRHWTLKILMIVLGLILYNNVLSGLGKLGDLLGGTLEGFPVELALGIPVYLLVLFDSMLVAGRYTWQSLGRYFGRFREAGIVKRILLVLMLVPVLVYCLIRWLVHGLFLSLGVVLSSIVLALGAVFWIIKLLWTNFLSKVAEVCFKAFDVIYSTVAQAYPHIIYRALRNRFQVMMIAIIPFVITLFVLLPDLGSELIPEVHQGEFNVELTLPVGTPVETTANIISPIEEMIRSLPGVKQVATVAGVDLTRVTDSESGEHTAKITVTLEAEGNLEDAENELMAEIRSRLSGFSGIEDKLSRPVLFSFKTPIEVEIKGYNLQDLAIVSRRAVNMLSSVEGLTDVKSNLQRGNPEVQIAYDRTQLARYGLNVLDVATLVRNKVLGDVATQFKDEERRIDIRVKVRDEDKNTIAQLKRLDVNPGGGIPIPLESVAKIEINEGPSEIRRIGQERSAVILANISDRDLSSVSADVFSVLQTMEMPEGFTFEITGQNKEMEVSLLSLQLALLLAIFMVYIVMASQFESFVHPFVILFTVPFALIGVVLILWILKIPLNIMVFLGLIMLAGIVVNNAIVLVDYINQQRRSGQPLEKAIETAGMARLRPILMTTMTTVLGLLPMALGLGEGAEIRTPMAITVIAGLISATALTLIVLPTVYAIFAGKQKPEPVS